MAGKKRRKKTKTEKERLEKALAKNKRYWDDRAEDLIQNIDKMDIDLEKELVKAYEDTSRFILKKISVFYAEYGNNNIIEYKRLIKKLSPRELNYLIKDMDSFLEDFPQYEHLRPIRKNIYKLDRLEGLKLSIELEELKLGEAEKEIITQHLEQVYNFSYNHTLKTLGYGTNFNTINTSLLNAAIGRKWAGNVTYLQRIEGNKEKIAQFLQRDLVLGLARGETYEKLSRTFKNNIEGANMKNARRLIRTEGTYLMNEASAEVFKEEFGEYIYNAVLDHRTTEICKSLNGKKFKFKDRQPGTNFPPMHPNCRSGFKVVIESLKR